MLAVVTMEDVIDSQALKLELLGSGIAFCSQPQ